MEDEMGLEIEAMGKASKALVGLDAEALGRVVHWAAKRFGTTLGATPRKQTGGDELEGDGGEREEPADDEIPTSNHFAELYHVSGASTHPEGMLVAAYWVQVLRGQEPFGSMELNKLLKDLGHGVTGTAKVMTTRIAKKPALILQLKKSGKSQQARKPKDMVTAYRNLEKEQGPRAARTQIPRMIMALYEISNNRGVGHTGGDVDPNHTDATAVVYMSKWVVAERVRLFHGLATDEATDLVVALVEREVALVWRNDGKRRVLTTGLSRSVRLIIVTKCSNPCTRNASSSTTKRREPLRSSRREWRRLKRSSTSWASASSSRLGRNTCSDCRTDLMSTLMLACV